MVVWWALLLAFDLSTVVREPRLDRRSDLALQYADKAVTAARVAYQEGRWQQTQEALEQVRAAVDLSYTSLMATGKNPRKDSAPFKRAEKATRDLLRRLAGLRDQMSAVDHEVVDPVIASVTEIHDHLLTGIMTGK